MYIEGMEKEELIAYEEMPADVARDPLGADLSGFEEMGLKVIRGG